MTEQTLHEKISNATDPQLFGGIGMRELNTIMAGKSMKGKLVDLLAELEAEEQRSIQVSHSYTEANDQPNAERVAHRVDGLRFAVRKLQAVLRDEVQT